MQPGDRLTLQIERPAAGGRMIARHEGAVVFVAGAIPGETVETIVEKIQRGTVWASTNRILEPSPDRLPDVPDGACGGCVFNHIRYDRQLALKSAIIEDTFRRLGRITFDRRVEVTPSPQEGYRMRARLHVRDGRMGFFREGTHTICDPAATRQLRPDTLDVLRALEAQLTTLGDSTAREIELSENIAASERAIYFEGAPGDEPLVSDLIRGATLGRHARSFFQGNRFLVELLVDHVLAAIDEGPIVDLYAGVGLFSLTAAAAGKGPVVAVEGDPHSAADLRRNADRFGGAVETFGRPVEEYLAAEGRRAAVRPATVIVDPPRSGMSRDALNGALALGASRIVYVSCDVATAARDARLIAGAGYALAGAQAFDMFPNTAHVEAVISFSRR